MKIKWDTVCAACGPVLMFYDFHCHHYIQPGSSNEPVHAPVTSLRSSSQYSGEWGLRAPRVDNKLVSRTCRDWPALGRKDEKPPTALG